MLTVMSAREQTDEQTDLDFEGTLARNRKIRIYHMKTTRNICVFFET